MANSHSKTKLQTGFKALEENIEENNFWYSERILFVGSLLVFLLSALLLTITEMHNGSIGQYNSFWDYLFNSVSVGTLTGLFRSDSGNYTFWGQAVLLFNMLISGILSSIVAILLILFVRVGLDKNSSIEKEVKRLGIDSFGIIKFIFIDFALIIGIGTIMFLFSGSQSFWEALFNASSHILNDGITALPGSMVRYATNTPVLLSGAFLVTIGGIGIGIRAVFYKWLLSKLNFKKLADSIPQSILAPRNFAIAVMAITLFLQIFGAIFIYQQESTNPNTFGSLPTLTTVVNSYYMSVSTRTAGFSTISDLNLAKDKTNFVMIMLMTIGASSGSFAGGIFKLTVVIFLLIYLFSRFRGDKELKTRGGFIHFGEKTYLEANFRILGFSTATIFTLLLLFFFESNISGYWLIFEAISAVSNTGLTLGATPQLSLIGMSFIMILMLIGKLGFISFVISFFPKLQTLLQSTDSGRDEFPVD